MEFNMDETKANTETPGTARKRAVFYFKEYCDYTGIHGFRYIAEDRTLGERIWWVMALVFSILFCSLMISEILYKYKNCPVIVTFCMHQAHINEIPFPAVTICPISKISQNYFNLTDAVIKKNSRKGFSGEIERNYNLASAICEFRHTNNNYKDITSDDIYNFINMSKTDIFRFCYYTERRFNCSDFFKPVLTEEGVCYSFNILDRDDIFQSNVYSFGDYNKVTATSDWDIEEGYTKANRIDYPFRAFRPGAKHGLSVILKAKYSDIEYDCSLEEKGFWVTLHLPANIPYIDDAYFTVPLDQIVTGQIIPSITLTSDDVKPFDASKRDCYFQSEKSLKFFKIYTQENCLLECTTDYILESCGCVKYFMPRYNDTPVCNFDAYDCIAAAEARFTELNLYLENSDEKSKKSVTDCNCLPACADLTYNWEISQSKLINKPRDKRLQLEGGYAYSILNLYFGKNYLETKERNELYGFSDLISNFGGLLGLFTGFSMLSFVEIIYFLSLRIWGNIRMYRNWSGKNTYDVTNYNSM